MFFGTILTGLNETLPMTSHTTTSLRTAEDLWTFTHNGKSYELVRGELREITSAGYQHGSIGSRLFGFLFQHVSNNELGEVVSIETGFVLTTNPDTVRAPDIAFIAKARLPQSTLEKFYPSFPDLAVEVISPRDTLIEVEEKVSDYLDAGKHRVWVVNPQQRTVTVHRPGGHASILKADDTLSGEEVIPGFTCRVGDLFTP